MKYALALIVSLTACTQAEIDEFFAEPPTHAEMCVDYGYAPGTGEYSQCRLTLQQEANAHRRAALQAWATLQQNRQPVYQMPQQRMPATTSCYRMGSFLNCTTQ